MGSGFPNPHIDTTTIKTDNIITLNNNRYLRDYLVHILIETFLKMFSIFMHYLQMLTSPKKSLLKYDFSQIF